MRSARNAQHTVTVVSQSSIKGRVKMYNIKPIKVDLSGLGPHKLSAERYFNVIIGLKFNLERKKKHLVLTLPNYANKECSYLHIYVTL